MKIQKLIQVEFAQNKYQRPVDLVQYDTGVQLVVTVTDFEVPTGTTATLYVQKPSGKFVYQETGITVSGNVITVNLENQALTEHGDVEYQLRLKNGSDTITTFAGVLNVQKSLADSGAVESSTVIAAFEAKTAEQIARIEAHTSLEISELQEESEKQRTAIENKGAEVLATIPADYTELNNKANEAIRTKADAVVCSSEGEAVVIADSAEDPIRRLCIFGKSNQIKTTGKNLLDVSRIADSSSLQNINGIITITAPSTSSSVSAHCTLGELAPLLTVGKDYIITFDTTGNSNYIYLAYGANTMWTNGKTHTITQEMLDSEVMLYASGVSTTAVISNMMIRLASVTDAAYEPYSGGAPSPSPEYPQEISSVGDAGNVNVNVNGTGDQVSQILTLSTPNGLHGVPVPSGGNYTDASGQQWVCDEIDLARGVFVKRIGKIVIDDGVNVYMNGTNAGHFYLLGIERARNDVACVCSHYTGSLNGGFNNRDGEVSVATGKNAYFWISDNRFSTVTDFKNWLAQEYTNGTPVTAVYALETPVETPLTAEEIAAYKALHTNKPNTTILNDGGAHMLVEYNADLKTYIDKLLAGASATRIVDVELKASAWAGSGNLYSQVVSIDGASEYSQVNLNPSVAQMSVFYEKNLTFITENDDGVITVYAIGQKPTNDYVIQATIREVSL